MKRALAAAIGLMALGMAPALAADLPAQTYSKTPNWIPAVYDWSGLYIGINGGWGSERRCFDMTDPTGAFIAADGCHNTSGGVAGGQFGYRWQFGTWVLGMEAQGDWANLRGSSASIVLPGNINRSRMDAFGLLTGQIGFAVNTALLYIKGGGAVVADRNDIISAGAVVATAAGDNRWGGAVGGGIEFAFVPDWSAAIEYDHLFTAAGLTTFNTPAGVAFSNDRIHGGTDLVTVRVNYRWGGPVIAKY